METKFTKGRWKISKETENRYSINSGDIDIWFNEVNNMSEEEGKANAKLIAASPIMYAKHDENDILCGQMLDLVKNNEEALNLLIKIKSNCCTAIQKATE